MVDSGTAMLYDGGDAARELFRFTAAKPGNRERPIAVRPQSQRRPKVPTDLVKTPWSMLSDEAWEARLLAALAGQDPLLPAAPAADLQAIYVGASGEKAIREAFQFYQITRAAAGDLPPDANVLDFGVGWGRTIRMWLRDVQADSLFGVDVDPTILEVARTTRVPGDLRLVGELGELPFDQRFDIIISFSVFSHLSERSARHWLARLVQSLKPGGTFVFTVLGQAWLQHVVGCAELLREKNSWEEMLGALFLNPRDVSAQYERGVHAFAPVGGYASATSPENYGWAALPAEVVRDVIGDMVRDIQWMANPGLGQDIFIVHK